MMKTNIATTQDQSQRLLRCGVSAESADMFYQTPITVSQKATKEYILLVRKSDETLFDTDIPAWSLSALLTDILPCDISDNEIDYSLFLQRRRSADNTPTWELSYYNLEYDATLLFVEVADPIEAAVQIAEKLTIDGYKLNGINENEQ